jgi:BRCA1-associated protein
MNTDTHQVWDFAGDGFVHRLIVEKGDPTDDQESVRTKLVEVADPHSHSHERPHRPPMSDQVEELLIHSKLERVARRYNNLLSWQLEQQRDQYQQELDSIRRSYEQPRPQAQAGGKHGSNETWGEQLIASLQNERGKLQQKCHSTTERIASAKKEMQFLQVRSDGRNAMSALGLCADRHHLKDLNESLLSNRGEWEAQTKAAEEELREAEQAYRRWIPALEKKVRDLMIRLEQSEAKGQDSEESKG